MDLDDNQDFFNTQVKKQQQIYHDQDQKLDQLHDTTKVLKDISITIHNELNDQSALLETLDEKVDNTNNRLATANKSVSKLLKMAKDNMSYIGIGILIIVLVILIVIAIKLPSFKQQN